MSMRAFLVTLLLCVAAGCASKGTTVVLIDDADGKVGQVEVATSSGTQILDAKGESTVVTPGKNPGASKVMPAEEIEARFRPVLDAQPAAPIHYLLYFDSGKVSLVPDSVVLLDSIVASAKQSSLCDVAVVGHSDTKGAKDKNELLSLQRAQAVRDQLAHKGIPAECMVITSHGEGNPVVPTADDVDEPKNRRVEVVIR